jgi:hypothetical protein
VLPALQVIVFSDNVWALETYARALNRPFIYGKTTHHERTQILAAFKRGREVNTVFLSKVCFRAWAVATTPQDSLPASATCRFHACQPGCACQDAWLSCCALPAGGKANMVTVSGAHHSLHLYIDTTLLWHACLLSYARPHPQGYVFVLACAGWGQQPGHP